MLPSPFATFYLFHTIHTDEWYLSWLRPTLSITLLLIHTNCFLKRSNARNRGHTGHSNWSWELLLIKVWEEFMEIIDSLWLNISSGVICYQCYLEDNNYISQEFLEAFFVCRFFPHKKIFKVFHFQKRNLDFPIALSHSSSGNRSVMLMYFFHLNYLARWLFNRSSEPGKRLQSDSFTFQTITLTKNQ